MTTAEGLRSDICMTPGCGHPGDAHEWGSCNECRCYVYDPYPALRLLKGAGMPGTTAEVTFIGGDYNPTQNGKDRWRLQTNDGREFGVWDKGVWEGVMQHLQQPLVCEVGSKQDDRGNWWNTLYAVPVLGLKAAGPGGAAKGGGATVDMTALVEPLNRIAAALENLMAWRVQEAMRSGAPAPVVGMDDGPQEPPE